MSLDLFKCDTKVEHRLQPWNAGRERGGDGFGVNLFHGVEHVEEQIGIGMEG